MTFELKGKVALITGAASGIGLEYAKELLRNGVKVGVALADVNSSFGQNALSEIKQEFGTDKAIFIKTDVTDIRQFEDAFKKTLENFKYVDILINNAGILDDSVWEKQISINVNGTIHGMLLGLENYLQKNRQGPDAVIVNISSTCGVASYPHIPIYCATKFAVIGMTKAWGHPHHYDRTKVRVVAICPGVTDTPLISDMNGRNLGDNYEDYLRQNCPSWPKQKPNHVAREVVKVIKAAPNATSWVVEGGEQAYEYSAPNREDIEKKYIPS
ncbi:hypothetical protein NQ318_021816 [Aromia moschata]|uniref:15-hydroxyprostaglandin dehydrogenase [NAD(+)]-like n=1 Tax=Aromia moschata TaxID=1265417 RepID=A0AAV8Z6B8_9CUCU|nr:hypothetical protein NQ318_021816 [Aromia moschata]